MTDAPTPLRPADGHDAARRARRGSTLVTRVVEVPVRPECVVDARRAVWRLASDAGLEPHRAEDLLIAVSEAVTNAIEAQLAAGVPDDLALTCRYDERRLEIELEDQGDGFDPSAIVRRSPMASPDDLLLERGWGITLMHTMVDDVAITPGPQGGMAVRLAVDLPDGQRADRPA